MFNLFVLNEGINSGFKHEILDILFFLSVICGILVITSKNPIISVLFLIGLFLNISIYLITLGINFIGLSYLLVYVGAVSILFLFILMLVNIRVSELSAYTRNSIPLAVAITIAFNYSFENILPTSVISYKETLSKSLFEKFNVLSENYDNEVYFATSKIWDGNLMEMDHINAIGSIMYTSYSMWLIIASLILMLAMIGAIVITIKPSSSD